MAKEKSFFLILDYRLNMFLTNICELFIIKYLQYVLKKYKYKGPVKITSPLAHIAGWVLPIFFTNI